MFKKILFLYFIFTVINAKTLLIVNSQNKEPYLSVVKYLKKQLNKNGYIEGKNLTIKTISLKNRINFAKRVIFKNPPSKWDVYFVNGTVATIGFKKNVFKNKKFKVIFASVTDPKRVT